MRGFRELHPDGGCSRAGPALAFKREVTAAPAHAREKEEDGWIGATGGVAER